jgi:hypothetical protein
MVNLVREKVTADCTNAGFSSGQKMVQAPFSIILYFAGHAGHAGLTRPS